MQPTYMKELHIRHVRHLKDIDIPLSNDQRKNLVLTGKNGSGKTSVLEAFASHLEYIIGQNPSKEECDKNISYYQKELTIDADTEEKRLEMQKTQKRLNRWLTYLLYWTSGTTATFTSLADLREKYKQGKFILAYFGDTRKINVTISRNIEKVDLEPFYAIRDTPSKDLAKYLVNLKTTQAFAQLEEDHNKAAEIERWFEHFENILRRIYHEDSLRLEFDKVNFNFSIHIDNRDPFDFNTMSMGYAAVFDIIADLIMRMESQHHYDLEGIVLIDEIETHLHVALQKEIVPILTELFPNIQFVLTTHSPFILNSTPNAVIYDLEKNLLVPDGLVNLPYEGIIEGYFDADLLSQKLRQKFQEYKQLVLASELSDSDYAKIAELEYYLDEIPDYLAVDFSAEYSRLKSEFESR